MITCVATADKMIKVLKGYLSYTKHIGNPNAITGSLLTTMPRNHAIYNYSIKSGQGAIDYEIAMMTEVLKSMARLIKGKPTDRVNVESFYINWMMSIPMLDNKVSYHVKSQENLTLNNVMNWTLVRLRLSALLLLPATQILEMIDHLLFTRVHIPTNVVEPSHDFINKKIKSCVRKSIFIYPSSHHDTPPISQNENWDQALQQEFLAFILALKCTDRKFIGKMLVKILTATHWTVPKIQKFNTTQTCSELVDKFIDTTALQITGDTDMYDFEILRYSALWEDIMTEISLSSQSTQAHRWFIYNNNFKDETPESTTLSKEYIRMLSTNKLDITLYKGDKVERINEEDKFHLGT